MVRQDHVCGNYAGPVSSIVEYFTSAFSTVLGGWGFAPIIADSEDQFRALEIAGYIGIMLCGAFPMVYLLNRYRRNPWRKLVPCSACHRLEQPDFWRHRPIFWPCFALLKQCPQRIKSSVIAFAVCAAFTFGDHRLFCQLPAHDYSAIAIGKNWRWADWLRDCHVSFGTTGTRNSKRRGNLPQPGTGTGLERFRLKRSREILVNSLFCASSYEKHASCFCWKKFL